MLLKSVLVTDNVNVKIGTRVPEKFVIHWCSPVIELYTTHWDTVDILQSFVHFNITRVWIRLYECISFTHYNLYAPPTHTHKLQKLLFYLEMKFTYIRTYIGFFACKSFLASLYWLQSYVFCTKVFNLWSNGKIKKYIIFLKPARSFISSNCSKCCKISRNYFTQSIKLKIVLWIDFYFKENYRDLTFWFISTAKIMWSVIRILCLRL